MFMPTITPIMNIITTITTVVTKANICAADSANAGMITPRAE